MRLTHSHKRDTKLDGIRESTDNEAKSIHEFCPTRWTVRGDSLEAIIENFLELMELWDWSLQNVKDPEMKGRIIGARSNMRNFNFLFGSLLGKIILKQTDNLSKTLQNPDLSAAEGQEIAEDVVMTLEKDRNENSFNLFWDRVEQRRKQLSVSPPKLK